MSEGELQAAVEFIKDKLYYCSLRAHPKDTPTAHFFSIDEELVYEPFFADFGPLNLGQIHIFCTLVDLKLKDPEFASKKIYYYSSHNNYQRANAALLISAYALIRLKRTPEEAFRPFNNIYPPFVPFRDASYGISTFNLTILDCLRGLAKAINHNFYNYETFNIEEYAYYERVEHGDLNWIIPGKFVAFSGPSATRNEIEGIRTFTPEDYHALFKKWNVTVIIRLNKKVYDRKRFVDHGFAHYDLYFVDGGLPSDAILRRFLEITENAPGAIAVHCKAGLGRTGTLIGCYLMKNYGFTAAEAIGYLRLCRPGSVIGPQQHYLKDMQSRLLRIGQVGDVSPVKMRRSLDANGMDNNLASSITISSRFNGSHALYSNGSELSTESAQSSPNKRLSSYTSRSRSSSLGRPKILSSNGTSNRSNLSSPTNLVSLMSSMSITSSTITTPPTVATTPSFVISKGLSSKLLDDHRPITSMGNAIQTSLPVSTPSVRTPTVSYAPRDSSNSLESSISSGSSGSDTPTATKSFSRQTSPGGGGMSRVSPPSAAKKTTFIFGSPNPGLSTLNILNNESTGGSPSRRSPTHSSSASIRLRQQYY